MALLGTLSTHCMGPGRCQLRHPMSHPGSWSGWGWRLVSPGPPGPAHCLGLMASPEAQLQPHVLSWGAGAWGRELRGPGTVLTLPASGGHRTSSSISGGHCQVQMTLRLRKCPVNWELQLRGYAGVTLSDLSWFVSSTAFVTEVVWHGGKDLAVGARPPGFKSQLYPVLALQAGS